MEYISRMEQANIKKIVDYSLKMNAVYFIFCDDVNNYFKFIFTQEITLERRNSAASFICE